VASASVAALLVIAVWLVRAPRVTFNQLLAISYVMIMQITLLEWLARGSPSPYGNLFLMPLVFAAGLHSPKRVAAVMATIAVAAFAPLAYRDLDEAIAADIGVQLLLWLALAGAMMALMTAVRGQRLVLRAGEEEAQRLARLDPLTGLGNRRAFDESLTSEISRARRTGNALSVVILDIDDFKEINDGFGHLNGDRCLREVAGQLRATARLGDTCFRWGGDEFAVLLPESNYEGATLVSERLRVVIGQVCKRPDGKTLTITCGTAELTEAANAVDFLAAADLALMALKTPSELRTDADTPESGSAELNSNA
jgi:diguanylate cyclase (GGDEF)-like protein